MFPVPETWPTGQPDLVPERPRRVRGSPVWLPWATIPRLATMSPALDRPYRTNARQIREIGVEKPLYGIRANRVPSVARAAGRRPGRTRSARSEGPAPLLGFASAMANPRPAPAALPRRGRIGAPAPGDHPDAGSPRCGERRRRRWIPGHADPVPRTSWRIHSCWMRIERERGRAAARVVWAGGPAPHRSAVLEPS
jgi:hypothetical protein